MILLLYKKYQPSYQKESEMQRELIKYLYEMFFNLFSSRWPSPGSSMAGSVWRLPAHHGAGERCDQLGAARPRMDQSKGVVQIHVLLSGAIGKMAAYDIIIRLALWKISSIYPKTQEELVEY